MDNAAAAATNNWKTVGGGKTKEAAADPTELKVGERREGKGKRERERRHITRQLCSFEISAAASQPVSQAWDEGAFAPGLLSST